MIEHEGGLEQEPRRPFSEKEKQELVRILEVEINKIPKEREEAEPDVAELIVGLEDIISGIKLIRIPQDEDGARKVIKDLCEIQNGTTHSGHGFSLQEEEKDVQSFYEEKMREILKRARETYIYFLDKKLATIPEENSKERARMVQEREMTAIDLSNQEKSAKKITTPKTPPTLQRKGDNEKGGSSPKDDGDDEIKTGPATIELARGINQTPVKEQAPLQSPILPVKEREMPPQEDALRVLPPVFEMLPLPSEAEPKKKETPKATQKPSFFQKMRDGLLGLFGMGVTAGAAYGTFEATEPLREEIIDAARNAPHNIEEALQAKKDSLVASAKQVKRIAEGSLQAGSFSNFVEREMAKGTYGSGIAEPLPEIHKESHIYTVQPKDTLWGLTDDILERAGVQDPGGTLTLKAVEAVRATNNIVGDPARSKKMWVGSTIDLSPVYDLVVSQGAAPQEQVGKTVSPQTEKSPALDAKHTIEEQARAHAIDTSTITTLETTFSLDLLSPSLNHSGETVFSRTHEMLKHIDVKPNVAKSSVLSAIALLDSHKTEAEAYRIKYTGHKKFDATKDTLDFTRAAQAALDLKAGMSPGDVAKKYGVADIYSKLRER